MFKFLLILSACLCIAYGAITIGPLEPKPEKFQNQKGCYIKDLDAVIPFGSSMPSKTKCKEFRCGTTMVRHVTCGTVSAVPPCKIVKDEKKPYPNCCPRIVCP